MADKDLDRRGKDSEEVAYFIPKSAQSYTCFGMMGHHYSFDKKNPLRVALSSDIVMFRSKVDVQECDANGSPLGKEESTKPLSYTKTAPPKPAPKTESPGKAGKSEVLTTDKPRKKSGARKPVEKEEGGKKTDAKPKKKKKARKPEQEDQDEEPEKKEEGWQDSLD